MWELELCDLNGSVWCELNRSVQSYVGSSVTLTVCKLLWHDVASLKFW